MLRQVSVTANLLISGCFPILVGGLPAPGPSSVLQPVLEPVPVIVETTGGTVCNGVRLNARTIATAAHCVSDGTTITVLELGITRSVANDVSHPGYTVLPASQAAGVDLAKLTVGAFDARIGQVAIRPIQARPVEIRVLTRSGQYRDITCGFLGQSASLVELTCPVELGWSGAPVVQDGALVGILSARGRVQSVDIVQVADAMGLQTF